MRLKPSDIGECWNFQRGRMNALKNLGFNPKNILDIGAYHGSWSEVMWHTWPDAQYHLIEANEQCIPQLDKTGFRYDIALLSDREEKVPYHKCLTGSGEGNGVYEENSPYPFECFIYPTHILNKIYAGERPELIKIDAQGYEIKILEGGWDIARGAHIIQLECQIQQYNVGAPLAVEVISYMDKNGFRLYDIGEYHYTSQGMLNQVDFIFANKLSPLFGLTSFA